MEKRAFEQTGLVPRSIIRTFDRFRRQLLKGAEASVIQEFRVSRYQVLVSVKCLASLLIIPLVVNFLAKTFFLMPLTEYLWNTQQNEIFLNVYQENRAFSELHDFEEKLFFESLIETQSAPDKENKLLENEKFYKTEVKNNTNILHRSLLTSKPLETQPSNIDKGSQIEDFLPSKRKYITKGDVKLLAKIPFLLGKERPSLNKNTVFVRSCKEGPSNNIFVKDLSVLMSSNNVNSDLNDAVPLQTFRNHKFLSKSGLGLPPKPLVSSNFGMECPEKTNVIKEKVNFTKEGIHSLFSENAKFSSGSALLSRVETPKQVQLIHSVKNGVFEMPSSMIEDGSFYLENSLPQKFQQKTIELAIYYNQQSIEAITNLFGDFITFITISFLFIWMEPQIIILKSFLTESIYSLSDTTKSFLLILLTDLLVGFHSPRGWEIFLEWILRHFGLPENQDFIFLFVATFPVLLDTVFKYWIFRYLNQISPSTVATYHSMIE